MTKIKTTFTKLRNIEWNTYRVVVAVFAFAAFCLPFIGTLAMATVVKLAWK